MFELEQATYVLGYVGADLGGYAGVMGFQLTKPLFLHLLHVAHNVTEVVVVGLADEMAGNELVALVVPKDAEGYCESKIYQSCAKGLVEAAQVILGHSKVTTTQIYAEKDRKKAIAIARKIG